MRKFFVSSNQIVNNEIRILNEDVNHIKNVLRLQKNDKIQICDKDSSKKYICEIAEVSKECIVCRILEMDNSKIEGNIELTVFQGLPKSDKMELIIQKCTELGAYDFVPVEFDRSVVKLNSKDASKKIERWQKIAEMAAKQSKRDLIPEVKQLINIKALCDEIKNYDLVLLAFENENENSLKNELLKIKKTKDKIKIAVIIGPEGGIEEKEVDVLQNSGAKVITLGKRILRTETAALSMASIIMYELET